MYDAADITPKPAAERIAIARRLAELGMRLAEKLTADVEAGDCQVADPALAFSRISRAVRMSLALEEKLEQGGVAKPGPQADYARLRGFILKDEAAHRVGEMIELEAEEHGEPREAERLHQALYERLDETDDLDIADRPLVETVRTICADLGVAFDPGLWENLAFDDEEKFPLNHEPLGFSSAHPREGGDPGFLSNSAADQEKRLGSRLRGDERIGDGREPQIAPPLGALSAQRTEGDSVSATKPPAGSSSDGFTATFPSAGGMTSLDLSPAPT